jgi:hypothetical protein
LSRMIKGTPLWLTKSRSWFYTVGSTLLKSEKLKYLTPLWMKSVQKSTFKYSAKLK